MRSAKSVKRSRITKRAYMDKSNANKLAKKKRMARKEWVLTTVTAGENKENRPVAAPVPKKAIVTVDKPAKKETAPKVQAPKKQKEAPKPKVGAKKEEPKPKVEAKKEKAQPQPKVETKKEQKQTKAEVKQEKEQSKGKVEQEKKVEVKEQPKVESKKATENIKQNKKDKKNEKKEKTEVQRPLSVDTETKVDAKETKMSVDSGVDVNTKHDSETPSPQTEKTASPSTGGGRGNSFFASVYETLQAAMGTVEKPTITMNPTATRRSRQHKLNERDIKYCIRLMELYGEDFETMSKAPENIFMDTAKGIERKVNLFKDAPQFQLYTQMKKDGKPLEEMLTIS